MDLEMHVNVVVAVVGICVIVAGVVLTVWIDRARNRG